MIPRTFPSTFAANGQQQMVVYSLPSITGLTAWIDYIPVKGVTTESATLENTYANGGYQVVDSLASLTGKQAWLDYIPVYEDASYTKPWSTDAGGYIPTSALAALLLDFTSGRLDPRITFSRTTNATLTNSAGLVANAPMNLLTFSEQFDNAAWVKGGVTITANATASPDGTTTADRYVESALNEVHSISSISVTAASGATYTLSVYAKNAGRFLRLILPAGTFGVAVSANFDLVNGIAYDTAGSGAVIQSVGNGWYRCSICVTATTGATGTISVSSAATSSGTGSYTGDGISGVYLWGAQLEIGSTATTYNPTTVKNLLGFTEHFDNAAWTKSNAFVQTNLLTYSQDFDNAAWQKSGVNITANTVVAPDGSMTADTFDATTGFNAVLNAGGTTVASSTTYTFSFYALRGTATALTYSVRDRTNSVDIISSVNYYSQTSSSAWARISVTFTTPATCTSVFVYPLRDSLSTGTVFIWGAQLVQGTSAGDYKATYAAAAAVGYTDIYGQPFAQKLVENTATVQHFCRQDVATTAGPYVLSFYAKAAERSVAWATLDGGSNTRWFNLSTGTTGGALGSSSITDVGGGWYRCSYTFTRAAGTAPCFIGLSNANNAASYTGDGTSGIYIFGAQLSDSASVDPYVYQPVAAPSSVAYYGPRFDYDPVTLAPKGLLIEEQRTNLLTYSEDFSNTSLWTRPGTGIATTGSYGSAPSGALSATRLLASAGSWYTQQLATTTSGQQYTISLWAKSNTGSSQVFRLFGCGSVVSSDLTITSVWQRVTFTFTATTGTGHGFTRSLAGDAADILVWGAQLEAGAFATSYIPTVASQVTRAADSASMIGNNFARWYNGNTNTFYTEVSYYGQLIGSATETNGIYLNDGTVLNQVSVRTVRDLTAPQADVVVVSASSTQLDSAGLVPVLANTVYRRAFAYATNSALNCINGALDGSTSTPFVLPTSINKLSVPGTFTAMHIKRIAYYNRRLSNTELQGITS